MRTGQTRSGRERRSFALTRVQLREVGAGTDESPTITGHAAVFNALSVDLGGFREKIAPGAFTRTIAQDDIHAVWNHDERIVLGRNKRDTLVLSEDEVGLAVEIDPPDTQYVQDVVIEPIKRGDVDQMSFMFETIEDAWNVVGGENIRTLLEVKLFEVSPVTFPAYPQTDVSARSALLSAVGIDFRAVAGALVRAERGVAPLEGDRDFITQAMAALRSALVRTTASSGVPIERMRRRLALAERTL